LRETDAAKETRKVLRITRKEADEINEEAERRFCSVDIAD